MMAEKTAFIVIQLYAELCKTIQGCAKFLFWFFPVSLFTTKISLRNDCGVIRDYSGLFGIISD